MDKIKKKYDSIGIDVIVVDNLKEATKEAYQNSKEGDVILLSPATASWDQYACFEDRGLEFKEIVKEISNEDSNN